MWTKWMSWFMSPWAKSISWNITPCNIKLNAFPTLTCENNCLRWKFKMHYMSLTNTSHGFLVVTPNWWENCVKIWSQNWRCKMWLMKWYNISSTKFKFGQTLWSWLWCYCEQPMGHIGNLVTHSRYWCPSRACHMVLEYRYNTWYYKRIENLRHGL